MRGTEKTKKIINLKGMKVMPLCVFPHDLLLSPETLWPFNTDLSNLVPRSLIDEAEGEIWSSKNYIFDFLIG